MDKNNNDLPRPKRKLLGQYFTNKVIAELLATLAWPKGIPNTVLDPMAGEGSMLLGAHSVFGNGPQYLGIEIDREIIDRIKDEFPQDFHGEIIWGNSFDLETWETSNLFRFDLVITNPPYIRYQSQTETSKLLEESNIENIRQRLIDILWKYHPKADRERHLFTKLIEGYSGLSDIAVPAWLLCGMLTKVGGTLAMIVPESWLSRDYASPIAWMLLKLFRIKYVVEDSTRTWFKDTQIKTTLIVAQRVEYIEDPFTHWDDKFFVYVYSKEPLNKKSPMAVYYQNDKKPNRNFTQDVESLLINNHLTKKSVPFNYEIRDLKKEVENTAVRISKNKYLSQKLLTQRERTLFKDTPFFPHRLVRILNTYFQEFTTLDRMGVGIGQGLRTGANDFFYLKTIENYDKEGILLVQASKLLGSKIIKVPKELTKPVFRFQSDLPGNKYSLNIDLTQWLLLLLEGYALPEDIEDTFLINPNLSPKNLVEHSPQLMQYLRDASRTTLRKNSRKTIPNLSAVRTNANPSVGRFWYTLPPLKKRHLPDILIPRVNSGIPKAWLNTDRKLVIDANFSTIWIKERSKLDAWGVLGLLNSMTLSAIMELTGAVMGGGALKLEATHLRRMPIPQLSEDQIKSLSIAGRVLASNSNETCFQGENPIDKILIGEKKHKEYVDKIRRIMHDHLNRRKKG